MEKQGAVQGQILPKSRRSFSKQYRAVWQMAGKCLRKGPSLQRRHGAGQAAQLQRDFDLMG